MALWKKNISGQGDPPGPLGKYITMYNKAVKTLGTDNPEVLKNFFASQQYGQNNTQVQQNNNINKAPQPKESKIGNIAGDVGTLALSTLQNFGMNIPGDVIKTVAPNSKLLNYLPHTTNEQYQEGRTNTLGENLTNVGDAANFVAATELGFGLAGKGLKKAIPYIKNSFFKPKIQPNVIPNPIPIETINKTLTPTTNTSFKITEPTTNTLQIKSTMIGSPLEKQLSKTGEINVNSIIAHINKADVGQQDKFILNKVLTNKFAGKTKIAYNDFRKAVSDELIPLEKESIDNYSRYGIGKLGYKEISGKSYFEAMGNTQKDINKISSSIKSANENPTMLFHTEFGDISGHQYSLKLQPQLDALKSHYETILKEYSTLPKTETLKYKNPKQFGSGSSEHFSDSEVLGHSRNMITIEEPDIYHSLERQSDYFQKGGLNEIDRTLKPENLNRWKDRIARHEQRTKLDKISLNELESKYRNGELHEGFPVQEWQIKNYQQIVDNNEKELKLLKGSLANLDQKKYLGKSIQERLLQEEVADAGLKGKIKFRTPTPETAAKIEGYKKIVHDYDYSIKPTYLPEHQTILKKYSETPSVIKKLFKTEPKTTLDAKGNSWYEFDIPESFKKGKAEIKALGVIPGVVATGTGLSSINWKNKK